MHIAIDLDHPNLRRVSDNYFAASGNHLSRGLFLVTVWNLLLGLKLTVRPVRYSSVTCARQGH